MNAVTPCSIFICLAGLVLNLCNVIVFLHQDWTSNTVTLTLLSISVSDFLVLVWSIIFNVFTYLQVEYPTGVVDYPVIQYYILAWTRALFYDISSLTTVLVSLERSLCVFAPMRVQTLLSLTKTKVALVFIWSLTVLSYAILFSTSNLTWAFNINRNHSRLTINLSPHRQTIEYFHNVLNTIILPSLCEIIVIINTVIMVVGLKRSSRFHQTCAASGRDISQDQTALPAPVQTPRRVQPKKTAAFAKYNRVLAVVCLLSCIFIVCNTPLVVGVYVKCLVKEFDFGGAYHIFFIATMDVIFLLNSLNASVNFFVYFSLNRKYRDGLWVICCRLINRK